MGEFLPLMLGLVIGAAAAGLRPSQRTRWLIPAAIIGGGVASAVNGELASELWAGFVSFDALLVWLGVAVSAAAVWYLERPRTAR